MIPDRRAAAAAIEAFLKALGHDPQGELAGTGERVAEAWCDDLLDGYKQDPAKILREGSIDRPWSRGLEWPALVTLRDLSVVTVCPHHLLPAHGAALIAYQPSGRIHSEATRRTSRVAGLGTLARVLDAFAHRLTLQEEIGENLVRLLCDAHGLGADGALCVLRLTHTCLVARGERKTGAIVETVSFGGRFEPGRELHDVARAVLREGR